MNLGRHLHELWRNRVGLIISIGLASLAALWSVGKISVDPPGIKPRVLQMGAAQTRALVDSPNSAVLDLAVPTNNLQQMTNRGVLVGNMIASQPVRAYIGRRAGIQQVPAGGQPGHPGLPAPAGDVGQALDERHRRLAQPVPAEHPGQPDRADRRRLRRGADGGEGAAAGQRRRRGDAGLPARPRRPPADPGRPARDLEQLGSATGGVINPGISVKLAALTFFIVFVGSALAVSAIARVRRGWRLADEAQAARLAA